MVFKGYDECHVLLTDHRVQKRHLERKSIQEYYLQVIIDIGNL